MAGSKSAALMKLTKWSSSSPMAFTLTSPDASTTKAIAYRLAACVQPGDVLSLTGDLGAGKTTFVQGLAGGLSCEGAPTSPTFTIIHEYECTVPLYHFDAYRLSGPEELERLGYEEYFYGQGLTVVEWGDIIQRLLPAETLTIEIDYAGSTVDSRQLKFSAAAGHFTADLPGYIESLKSAGVDASEGEEV